MKVTFCGHRTYYGETDYIKERLDKIIENLIKQGATEFFMGNNGTFDYLSAVSVKKAKEKYPHIRSVLVQAYREENFDKTLYDELLYPPIDKVPLRFAIVARNEYLIKTCDILISGTKLTWGGAYKTREKAIAKKKQIIDIF